MRFAAAVVVFALALAAGCGGSSGRVATLDLEPRPRRCVVWLEQDGVDEITAAELARVGVDALIVPRGVLDLAGETPVLGLTPPPTISGGLPVGMMLSVKGTRQGPGDDLAEAVWRSITAQERETMPAEIVLDLPNLPEGTSDFIAGLVAAANVPIVPLLSVDQLRSDEARRVARAAGRCVVPAFGTGHELLRGVGEGDPLPLVRKLEPLADLGVGVRIAVGLRPVVEPATDHWGDDLNPLTEPENAEISTSSPLDRTFVLRRRVEWSGASWSPTDTVAIRWWDASRLHGGLAEIDRLVLPDVVGWDLVPLPPLGRRLGIGQEGLLRYLGGEGPEPDLKVEVERSGRSVGISVANTSPFASAVSGVGNWFEVSVTQGSLMVNDRGGFDSVELGSRRGGRWQSRSHGTHDAVRFGENYVAPFEEIETVRMRLSVSRARVTVRWHLVLSSGQEVTGQASQ
jgi:hypothetical protein